MDLDTFRTLIAAHGQGALSDAASLRPTEASFLRCFDRMRRTYPAPLCRAALETVILREKARRKFTLAGSMYFTRAGLEMATGEAVAAYRASRYQSFRTVTDLCSGIGGDSISLGLAGCTVHAVDSDPLHSAIGQANTAAHRLDVTHQCADVLTVSLPLADAAFADPGRRADGRRVLSLRDTFPPVEAIRSLYPLGHPLGVKVAPGVPKTDILGIDAESEFISLDGELKECVLWFGELKKCSFSATVLPGPHRLVADALPPSPLVVPSKSYLYDPDPAVVRSGLLPMLAEALNAGLLDPEIAYLTADQHTTTPFATVYRIEETMPFNVKTLGQALRSRGVGRVTILKRGSPVDVNELRSRWKLSGDAHRCVVVTRAAGRPVGLIAERVD